jgi:hypothetical protein
VKLTERITELVAAGFAGIWVETQEPHEAEAEITELANTKGWGLFAWDAAAGDHGEQAAGAGAADPTYPLKTLRGAWSKPAVLALVHNYHLFLKANVLIQDVINTVLFGKAEGRFLVVLAPVVTIPQELEKLFVVVEHDLPEIEQLATIAADIHESLTSSSPEVVPPHAQGFLDDAAVHAATGLTRFEAEGAFALSLARHASLSPADVWEIKQGMLKKSGLLTLHRGGERFDDLGGLVALKTFCRRALCPSPNQEGSCSENASTSAPSAPDPSPICKGHSATSKTTSSAAPASAPSRKTSTPNSRSKTPRPRPKGILLLGVPGTGKSAFAKALGNETGRPTLTLDVGALMGSLVGQTEANVRRALAIADAMSPSVLFLDEVEKALAGAQGGHGDSGVAARLFGTLLTWLNDHTSDVFVVCTSNDVSKLPPEFSRAERFDAVFFIDLPQPLERPAIWAIYQSLYGIAEAQADEDLDDDGWTGAEIHACCRLAALLGLSLKEASKHVVPVAKTSAEKVAALREWAGGRCLSASTGAVYRQNEAETRTTNRRALTTRR